jgi:hypothetical protein
VIGFAVSRRFAWPRRGKTLAEREGFYAALILKAEVLAGYKFTMRLVKNIAEKVPGGYPV